MAEDGIVEAVGTASSVSGNKDLSKRIEAAMSQAVTDALAEGIAMDDTETIKARIMAARSKVLDEAKA